MSAFIAAFAAETGLDFPEAESQWAGFSNQLSESRARAIERGGTRTGTRMGRLFKIMFPESETKSE